MPYLLLAIGFVLGLYGLYRFFINANVQQIKALFITAFFTVVCIALFFMAVTGRLPAALGLVAALWPIALAFWHKRRRKAHEPGAASQPTEPMSHDEALKILGLDEGADEDAIKAAHKKLIKKTHPDQEGSEWLAAKINQARDMLLDSL